MNKKKVTIYGIKKEIDDKPLPYKKLKFEDFNVGDEYFISVNGTIVPSRVALITSGGEVHFRDIDGVSYGYGRKKDSLFPKTEVCLKELDGILVKRGFEIFVNNNAFESLKELQDCDEAMKQMSI